MPAGTAGGQTARSGAEAWRRGEAQAFSPSPRRPTGQTFRPVTLEFIRYTAVIAAIRRNAPGGETTPPIFGLGLHVLIAIYFAVHAVRTGQHVYWLIILFSFPLLGSLAYFLAVYLPNSRLDRGARRAVAAAARALDPDRALREARSAFEDAPTAQNQMRVAAVLLDLGFAEEAARNYEPCLNGPFAADLEVRFGAARAFVECQRHPEAIRHLEAIRSANAKFRPEALAVLLARSYAGAGRPVEARAEFEAASHRFGTFEVRAEYLMWALVTGDSATAARQQSEVDKLTRQWNAHARELDGPTMRRLNAAYDLARKGA